MFANHLKNQRRDNAVIAHAHQSGSTFTSKNARKRSRLHVASAIERLELRRLLSTVIVNTLLDETTPNSTTSLREAIQMAQPNDTIQFSSSLTGSINLDAGGELTINKNLTIGPPTGAITISGVNEHRVFHITDGSVTISGLKILDGSDEKGAGIYNEGGSLTLNDVSVVNNSALGKPGQTPVNDGMGGQGAGGGIYNTGTLIIQSGTIGGNSATGGAGAATAAGSGSGGTALGAGIYNDSLASCSIINSTVAGNNAVGGAGFFGTVGGVGGSASGAGVYNLGTLVVSNSTFAANGATGVDGARGHIGPGGNGGLARGGAIYNARVAQISGSRFSSNVAFAGEGGDSDAAPAIMSGNGGDAQGGAIYSNNQLEITDTQLVANTASAGRAGSAAGGAIYAPGTLSVKLSKIDSNVARSRNDLAQWPSRAGGNAIAGGILAESPVINGSVISNNKAQGGDGGVGYLSGAFTHAAGAGGYAKGGGLYLSGDPNISYSNILNNVVVGGKGGAANPTAGTGAGNDGDSFGAGLYLNYGSSTTIDSVTIAGNAAQIQNDSSFQSQARGGGIYADHVTLSFTNGAMDGNDTVTAGSAIYATGDKLSLSKIAFTSNSHGTPMFVNGVAALTDCLWKNNSGDSGGGIDNEGSLTLTRCAFDSNAASTGEGVLRNNGTLTAVDSTFVNNKSGSTTGAIHNNGTMTLTNCTFAANSAGGTNIRAAGAVSNRGTAVMANCTFTENTAPTSASAVFASAIYNDGGKVTTTSCTVSANGTGAALVNSGTWTPGNCIVAANAGGDAQGAFNSMGFNFIGIKDGSTGWTSSDLTGTSTAPLAPKLLPLADNGGPVKTMAPASNSPVIDQGKAFSLASDARHFPRTFDATQIPNATGGDGTDMGATELQTVPVGDQVVTVSAAQPATLQFENYNSGGEGVGYHDLDSLNIGGAYRPNEGVDLQPTTDTGGGYNLGWARGGEWVRYTLDVVDAGSYQLAVRIASNGAGGTFHLELDGKNITGSITVPNTGGWQNWQNITTNGTTLSAGNHVLTVLMDTNGASGYVGNFNWIKISAESTGHQTPFFNAPVSVTSAGATIEAENFDKGGEGVAVHDTDAANLGGADRPSEPVDIQSTTDTGGGYNVGWTHAGEWLEYSIDIATSGDYSFAIRGASVGQGGNFHLELDGVPVTGTLTVPNTGDWQKWTTLTSNAAHLGAGDHILRLAMDTNGASGFTGNFNWVKINSSSAPFTGTPVAISSAPVTIQAEDFNKGGEGVAVHDTDAANLGGAYRAAEPVDLQPTTDTAGGFNVGWTKAGEWLEYSITGSTLLHDIDFRVASAGQGGTFHLELDGANLTGVMTVPNTGGWQNWVTITAHAVSFPSGEHILRLVMDSNGPGGYVGNFNWMKITTPTQLVISSENAAYVRDGDYANTNFGEDPLLLVKDSTPGFKNESYIKFDLSSIQTVSSAKLRLFGRLWDDVPFSVNVEANWTLNSWDESTITWNNRPLDRLPLGTFSVSGNKSTWYELDLTNFIKSEIAAGHKNTTIRLRSLTFTATVCEFLADSTAQAPQLLITP